MGATPTNCKRRWLKTVIGCAALAPVLFLTVWALDLRRPRHAMFEEHHGAIVSMEVEAGDAPSDVLTNDFVTLRSDTGLNVRFRILRPASPARRLPVILLLAGHRTGSNAVALVGDPGPVAVVALDYPYDGPQKFHGTWEAVSNVPKVQRALLDTPTAAMLVVDWLLTQSWVDPEQIELVGASLGVPFAAVAGAIDVRIRRVWLIHGGADNQAWLKGALRREIANDTLRGAAASALLLVAHGATFDTAHWVPRISPRPVVIIGAREDESLTHDNVEALFEAAGEPKELIWTEGGHVQRNRPEVVQQLLAIVREQI